MTAPKFIASNPDHYVESFYTWFTNGRRRGKYDDLKQDILADSCFPVHATSSEEIRRHVAEKHDMCSAARDVLIASLRAYRKAMRRRENS